MLIQLGKGSKIKLIIFAEFSAKGFPSPIPLSRKIINFSPTFWMAGGDRGGVVILMSLLYYMFQSILNTFAFGYFFGGKKLIIFTDGGNLSPSFAENSAKIINLIFEPFPKVSKLRLGWLGKVRLVRLV